jgi:hypothetical protein
MDIKARTMFYTIEPRDGTWCLVHNFSYYSEVKIVGDTLAFARVMTKTLIARTIRLCAEVVQPGRFTAVRVTSSRCHVRNAAKLWTTREKIKRR